ncbi:MAG: DUF309 domain-containing protein [Chloroflexota bacterium]
MTTTLHPNTLAACQRMDTGDPRCRCGEAPSALFLHGIAQFNRREFFECHETLEVLWLAESDDVRFLYQGILQIGVGYLHLLRGNHHGAITKLRSGTVLLAYFGPRCLDVNVEKLLADAQAHLRELEALGPRRLAEFDVDAIPTIDSGKRLAVSQ